MIEARNIFFSTGNKTILHPFSYTFEPGKISMICGPNGAGKSTLLKMLSLEMMPSGGSIIYNQHPGTAKNRNKFARSRAVLSQHIELAFPLPVFEVVMMGRYPYFHNSPSAQDIHIVYEALRRLEVDHLAQQNFLTLSGGEKQRVHFARVMAQTWEMPDTDNRILLLDEPVSFLDLKHQVHLMQQIKNLVNSRTVIILIMHDLNLVLNFADEVLLLADGKLLTHGKPSDVLTEANILHAYKQPVMITQSANHRWIWPEF